MPEKENNNNKAEPEYTSLNEFLCKGDPLWNAMTEEDIDSFVSAIDVIYDADYIPVEDEDEYTTFSALEAAEAYDALTWSYLDQTIDKK